MKLASNPSGRATKKRTFFGFPLSECKLWHCVARVGDADEVGGQGEELCPHGGRHCRTQGIRI